MTGHVEHFIYGSAARLKQFRAALPEGISVIPSFEGITLREALPEKYDLNAAIARIEALAAQYGVNYDGHGQSLNGAKAESGQKGVDLLNESFAKRTGIQAGHGFALPLPDGRFGHGVFLGQDAAYLMLNISTLVTNAPAAPEQLRAAQMRYRQPILVWHTRFDVVPLAPKTALATLPCNVVFRNDNGLQSPAQIKKLQKRFGIADIETSEGWVSLLVAMAAAGARLPAQTKYTTWHANVARTGKMQQMLSHDLHRYKADQVTPLPWNPSTIDVVQTALCGGVDMIAVRDFVRY